jgi:hypothetical protein
MDETMGLRSYVAIWPSIKPISTTHNKHLQLEWGKKLGFVPAYEVWQLNNDTGNIVKGEPLCGR